MRLPIFELRFEEIVNVLPPLVIGEESIKINYGFGDIDELKRHLANNPSAYPLVWLMPSTIEENRILTNCKSDCTISVAVNSTKLNEFNKTIYNTDFKNIIDVVSDDLIHALATSSISNIGNSWKRKKDTNFEVKATDKQSAIAIWNAKFIEINIEFNNNCLRPIIF